MSIQIAMRIVLVLAMFITGLILIFSGKIFLGVLLSFILVGLVHWATLNPSSRIFGPIQTVNEQGQGVWLTIDDGPDPKGTPEILNLLESHHVKATFFVIGRKAEKYPELIKLIQEKGHQIGNHTYSHPQASFWCAGPIRTYREIYKCQRVLEEILGVPPTLFRAPVGHHNMFVQPVLKHFGLSQIGWNCRCFDAVSTPAKAAVRRIRKNMQPDSIVLVHEATPIAKEVITGVLEHAQMKKWSFDSDNLGSSSRSSL